MNKTMTTSRFFEEIACREFERKNGLDRNSIKRKGFKKELRQFARTRMSETELSELNEWCGRFNFVTDGYSINEMDGNYIVKVFEVENRNPISANKLTSYSESWFEFDCWGCGEWIFELCVLDKLGNEKPVSLRDVWYSIKYARTGS